MAKINWRDPDVVAALRALVARGDLTYREMAATLGVTPGSVAGAVARILHGKKTPSDPPSRVRAHNAWTESRLTEPWTEYAARRRAERSRGGRAA